MQKKPMNSIPFILYPINWVVGIIVIIILNFSNQSINNVWPISYALGLVTGLLNFGIMIRAGRRFEQLAKKGIKPNIWISFSIRLLVFVGVFLAIYFDAKLANPRFSLIVAFCGYIQVRLVLIIYTIFRREKVKSSDTDATNDVNSKEL